MSSYNHNPAMKSKNRRIRTKGMMAWVGIIFKQSRARKEWRKYWRNGGALMERLEEERRHGR